MRRIQTALLVASLSVLSVPAASAQESGEFRRSAFHDYRVVTVAEGLVNPWSMAFLPNGDMLITERPGRLRIVRGGRLLPNPVRGVPAVVARGQGGLMEVVLHPDFGTNRLVYLSYSKEMPGDRASTTAIVRARFENDELHAVEDVFVANSAGAGHYGSRLAFDREGFLFFTVGDRQAPPTGNLEAHPAQDRSNHHGTVNRIHADGRIPEDNPFVGQAGFEPSIYSYGHRNSQGLAIDGVSGTIWATEHGPQGGDEVNLIVAGGNYGWPVVGYGVNYGSGSAIHEGTMREGWENPRHIWVPSIGTSGLALYTGERFPAWRGNLFAGGLAGEKLVRLTVNGDVITGSEDLLQGLGRVRAVSQGPDGFIYVAIENRGGDPSPVVRLEPARQ